MKRAVCRIRHALVYRREVFLSGLAAAGYRVCASIDDPEPGDVLVLWNRYGINDDIGHRYEKAGARVVVCENAYLGKDWLGDTWFAMALGHHCGAGLWVEGGFERWDSLGVLMKPFRDDGTETLILGQRGIGEPDVASPRDWAEHAQAKYGGRIRPHPGNNEPRIPLEKDLSNAKEVLTWHSAAALHALLLGVPVWYDFKHWIGAMAGRPLKLYGEAPCKRSDPDRVAMFRRLIWAQWRLSEIASGKAFSWLLQEDKASEVA